MSLPKAGGFETEESLLASKVRLERLIDFDSLTGIANRPSFDKACTCGRESREMLYFPGRAVLETAPDDAYPIVFRYSLEIVNTIVALDSSTAVRLQRGYSG